MIQYSNCCARKSLRKAYGIIAAIETLNSYEFMPKLKCENLRILYKFAHIVLIRTDTMCANLQSSAFGECENPGKILCKISHARSNLYFIYSVVILYKLY